jgi:ribosomal protein S18 acetylase RimI-like enzyme
MIIFDNDQERLSHFTHFGTFSGFCRIITCWPKNGVRRLGKACAIIVSATRPFGGKYKYMLDHLRLATLDDLPDVKGLFKEATDLMISQNILQWDEFYPDADLLHDDISAGHMHLLIADVVIAAAIVLDGEQGDSFAGGCWTIDGPAGVIHRLCVRPGFQDRGVGRKMILYAEHALASEGYTAVRLDAFPQNKKAIHLYQSLGYKRAGSSFYRKGEFYLYEKRLPAQDAPCVI